MFDEIYDAYSTDRLSGYGVGGATREEVLARYLWNTALSESLYPALQNLEVVFRNRIHAAATSRFSSDVWYDRVVLDRDRQQIDEAKSRLLAKGKDVAPGRVVGELHFGFWTSLLSRSYDEQLLWPALLAPVFPHLEQKRRTRKTVVKRFNSIRELRNRVFHYEPIWRYTNLDRRYQEIVEATEWMSPQANQTVGPLTRFHAVHRSGLDAMRTHVDELLQKS